MSLKPFDGGSSPLATGLSFRVLNSKESRRSTKETIRPFLVRLEDVAGLKSSFIARVEGFDTRLMARRLAAVLLAV